MTNEMNAGFDTRVIPQTASDLSERNDTCFDKALALVKERHAGQTDKAGKPYVNAHLLPVARMAHRNGEPMPVVVAALLHDILEDTDTTREELRAAFSDEIAAAVAAMTHRPGEDYMAYIRRLKQNPIACRVKRYDLANNMDLSRLPHPTEADRQRLIKYAQAYAELMKE